MADGGYNDLAALYQRNDPQARVWNDRSTTSATGIGGALSFMGAKDGGVGANAAETVALDARIAGQDAQAALDNRARQMSLISDLQNAGRGPNSVNYLQQQQALGQIAAQRSAMAQSGAGSNRGLMAVQAPALGEAQSQQARVQALADQMAQVRAISSAYSGIASGDQAARLASYEQARANQEALMQREKNIAKASEESAQKEQDNAAKGAASIASVFTGGGLAGIL